MLWSCEELLVAALNCWSASLRLQLSSSRAPPRPAWSREDSGSVHHIHMTFTALVGVPSVSASFKFFEVAEAHAALMEAFSSPGSLDQRFLWDLGETVTTWSDGEQKKALSRQKHEVLWHLTLTWTWVSALLLQTPAPSSKQFSCWSAQWEVHCLWYQGWSSFLFTWKLLMLVESSQVDFSSQSSAVCAPFPPLFPPGELSTPTPVRTVDLFSGDLLCIHPPAGCWSSSSGQLWGQQSSSWTSVSHSHPKHFTWLWKYKILHEKGSVCFNRL